jgi:histidine triad (HIT) family protein
VPFDLPQGPCIFCERISGERSDWAVIEQDDLTISWVAPIQFEEGQALVIPRRHAETLLDLTDDESVSLMRHVRRIADAIVAAFEPDGLTLYQNNGVVSYQAIPHVHMHVVPRRYGGGWGEGPPHLAAITRAEREERFAKSAIPLERLEALAERVRTELANG